MRRLLIRLLRETIGQNLAEVALLLMLVSLVGVAALQEFACSLNCTFEIATTILDKAQGKIPPGQLKKCSKKC